MGCQTYKLPCSSRVYEESWLKCLRLSQPTWTFGDLPSNPKMFKAIYEYVENCTVGRSPSTERGKTHTATSPGKPELEKIQDMYIHKLPVDSFSCALQVFICCELSIVVSSKMKFFFPAKNVTLELKKMRSPSKAQCMYKKRAGNPAKSVAGWEQKRHCASITISHANLHLQWRWVLPGLRTYTEIHPKKRR